MLKEGFAIYFSHVGVNQVYPEWNMVILMPCFIKYTIFDFNLWSFNIAIESLSFIF